jgi:restriction endonuclease S subunit
MNFDINNVTNLIKIDETTIRNPYFLRENDIVLVSRGSGNHSFRATVFMAKEKNVIASSSLLVLRLLDNSVFAKYLSIYLNSTAGKKQISQILSGGSYLQNIRSRDLKELEIPILSKQLQQTVMLFVDNVKEQREILERKKVLLKEVCDSVFINK